MLDRNYVRNLFWRNSLYYPSHPYKLHILLALVDDVVDVDVLAVVEAFVFVVFVDDDVVVDPIHGLVVVGVIGVIRCQY